MILRGYILLLVSVVVLQSSFAQWTKTGNTFPGRVTSLVVKDDTLFAATIPGGIYRSRDQGNDWENISAGLPDVGVNGLCFKDAYLFAATSTGGIFRSADGGSTWTAMNDGLTSMNVKALAGAGEYLFAAMDLGGISRSTDDGTTWTPVPNGLIVMTTYFALAVVPDAEGVDGRTIFAGSSMGAFRSRDNGENWAYVPSGLTSPWPSTVVSEFAARLTPDGTGVTELFAATNGGVFRSTNYGTNWSAASNGIPATGISSLVSGAGELFASTFGGTYVSNNAVTAWDKFNLGLSDTLVTVLGRTRNALYAGTLGGTVWTHPLVLAAPESLSFGPVTKDSTGSRTVVLKNASSITLSIDSIRTGSLQFHAVSSARELLANDTMHIFVGFTPNGYGKKIDTLVCYSAGLTTRVFVPLTGDSPPPQLAIGVPKLILGPIALGDTSKGQITLYNTSPSNRLTISQVRHGSPSFTVGPVPPLFISARDSIVCTVLYSTAGIPPSGFGTETDTLVIVSDGGTSSIAMTGTSPAPMILLGQGSIAFGSVGVTDSLTWPLAISNGSPNTLVIDSAWCSTKAFWPAHATVTVHSKDTVDLPVVFSPSVTGSHTDTLFLRSNASIALVRVPLSGVAPLASVKAIPNTLIFGIVHKDSTSRRLVKLTNLSLTPLRLDTLYTRTKYFGVAHIPAGTIINKGETTAVSISFSPDTSKGYKDTVYVVTDASALPYKVSLNGIGTTVGVALDAGGVPAVFELRQNYPNPFNPSTTIRYSLPVRAHIVLKVFNAIGQEVAVLQTGEQDAGIHEVRFDARALPSGVYFYRIQAAGYIEARRLLLLR